MSKLSQIPEGEEEEEEEKLPPKEEKKTEPSKEEQSKKKPPSSFASTLKSQMQRSRNQASQGYIFPSNMLAIPVAQFDSNKSINAQQEEIKKSIVEQLQAIEAKPAKPGTRRGYRFYDPGMGGLQSASEQQGQTNLPSEVRKKFLSGHAEANKKQLQEGGATYYSPFVSLTESLSAFINTSFGPRGDVNIRHDVLHRAPMLGAFDLPVESIEKPSKSPANPDQSLPQQEKEILFDASTSTLAEYRSGEHEHHNPFRGKVKIDYNKLLASRGLLNDNKYDKKVREYQGKDDQFDKGVILSEEQSRSYIEHLQEGEKLQQEIFEYQPTNSKSAGYSSKLSSSPSSSMTAQSQQQQQHKVATKEGNQWYDGEQVIEILSRNSSGYQVLGVEAGGMNATAVASIAQLQTALSRIPQNDVHYLIPMRLNVNTRTFDEQDDTQNNHWVGLHIRRANGDTTVTYVDPTGREPSQEIIGTVVGVLGQNVVVHNLGIQLQYGQINGTGEFAYWEGNSNDCGPMMIQMLQQLALGEDGIAMLRGRQRSINSLAESQALGQDLRAQQQNGNHLKRAGKQAGEVYDIRESFAVVNGNSSELLEKIRKEALITADIDLKAVDVKERVTPDKVGKVEFLAEGDHIKNHAGNTKFLIERIESGDIGKGTVIAIERKSYGRNLGVPDVIMLANIIGHNENNPEKKLKIPEEITTDSLIYQDAVLYNTAKKRGVKVIGLEGKNLDASKDTPEEYNTDRENYMASRINQLTDKGYNVIAYVGSAHVYNLKRAVENKPSKVSEGLQESAMKIGMYARVHVLDKTTSGQSTPVLNKQPIGPNSIVGDKRRSTQVRG